MCRSMRATKGLSSSIVEGTRVAGSRNRNRSPTEENILTEMLQIEWKNAHKYYKYHNNNTTRNI